MKQIIQSFKTGDLTISDVPAPAVQFQGILVLTSASLVSAGTERMLVDFAEKNLLQKARSRPDLVRQTVDKARREGILTTLEAVQNRLDKPVPLGYSCAGSVIEVGAGISEFKVGDRVACAGVGYANHAEVVAVPKNLAVKLPANVDFESASFTTVGAIALQGIRLAEVKLGEVVAVIGLGLLGQLTTQMLKAAGCIVVGLDIRPERAELALRLGADAVATTQDDLAGICQQLSAGHGADAVLITAHTKSNQPIELAGNIARDKAIVVAVGAVGMDIPRTVYFQKELDFRISRSYGPGRYDQEYEEKGHDYPYAYVRWTEQRNMQAFVAMLADGKVKVAPLITHRFPIVNAPAAYELITGRTGDSFLGVVLTYPEAPDCSRKVVLSSHSATSATTAAEDNKLTAPLKKVRLGMIGAGSFATATLLPAIKAAHDVELIGIVSGSGLSASSAAKRYGFTYCTTDENEVLNDPAVNTVAILTRHNLHARQVVAALKARKNVFVEKPLCLSDGELQEILSAYRAVPTSAAPQLPMLAVGFNRRFAPFLVELKQHLQRVQEPMMLHYRVNAGLIAPEHWTQDQAQGGRLLGEACHFIDALIYLTGSTPQTITARALPDGALYSRDNLLITLEFANGSIGTVNYLANGNKRSGKEFLEVFGGGVSAQLDDYRKLAIYDGKRSVKRVARLRQDKGHRNEWQAITAYLTGKGPEPMTFAEMVLSTEATLAAQLSLQEQSIVKIHERDISETSKRTSLI
jgi:predicted dehydrogenase/threonine dehydrogenase-like Zn-dependent dehydrogenase